MVIGSRQEQDFDSPELFPFLSLVPLIHAKSFYRARTLGTNNLSFSHPPPGVCPSPLSPRGQFSVCGHLFPYFCSIAIPIYIDKYIYMYLLPYAVCLFLVLCAYFFFLEKVALFIFAEYIAI